MMSLMVGSFSRISSGPSPNTSSRISSVSFSRSPIVMGRLSSMMSFSTTVPTCPRTLSLFRSLSKDSVRGQVGTVLVQVFELLGGQRVHQLLVNQAFQFEPTVGSRSGTDNASATHGVLSLCRFLQGLRGLGLFAAGGFIHEGAENAVQLARLFAIGHERPSLVDGCDHRRRTRNAVEHRLVERLLDLLQAGLVGGDLLGVAVHHHPDLILVETHAHQIGRAN